MAPAAGLAGLAILLLLIALRMPIGLALGVVGIGGTWALLGWDTLVFALGSAPVEAMSNFTLSVLPLFIFMGILAVKAGFAESLYQAAYAFVGHRRGGLAIASIVACGGFGAVSGSSLATVAAMGKLAVPEMLRYGYSRPLAAGSVATAGTVAILIPPSLPMIIFALLTEVSIGKLFAAGILPGILAVLLYSLTTVVWMWARPQDGPAGERMAWIDRLRALGGVWGVVSIFLLVLGGIFGGLFSPTEGASVGAAGALLLGILSGRIGWRAFVDAVSETVVLTAAILFVVIGVSLFSFFVTGAHFPQFLSETIGNLDLSKYLVLAIVVLLLIVLGCFLDVIAIVFVTTPVLFPIMRDLGFHPVWYGIVTMMVVEFGAVTPPIGMNIFVLAKQLPQVSAAQAFKGIAPYLVADTLRLLLIVAFPVIVLWLPGVFFQ